MKKLLKYNLLAKLGESMHSQVFKVCDPGEPSKILVLRKVRDQFVSAQLDDYLNQQIELLSQLTLPNILIPQNLEVNHRSQFLIQGYYSDFSLTQWLSQNHNLKEILEILIEISKALESIHKAGHIHKGIKPNNILLNLENHAIQLIDDVRVLDINQISHFIYDDLFRIHTLPYLSPEQTGRIKYSVDYSTDLYALGMIFFEALTGKAIFLDKNSVAILHSHLAEIPPRVESINPDIPVAVGDIVERLLKKSPEKRYQTATGLKIDLQHCLLKWEENKSIPTFTLARKDYSNHISIPSLLVGRSKEKLKLLAEFEKCSSGKFCGAIISGLSGIGKTRLIQELQLPIVNNHAYFCSGKFDQFKKHIPYNTLTQAFSYLVKSILTEDKQRLVYWKNRIANQLGSNARLMTDLIPELELIIGSYEEVKELPPIEARNRFNDTVGKFITCFADKEHPLVLFIDDLQWCDGASFDLLEQVFDNYHEYQYVFWIGAYRHNEVDNGHRLTRLIKRIKRAKRPLPLIEIRLEALGLEDVNRMSAYILNTYASRTHALSEVIYKTSAGNPLFVNECLRWLHTFKHLHLSESGEWDWDDKQIRHAHMPDSALDLFKDKISKLSPELQQLLAISAALGARFNAKDLAVVAGISLEKLYNSLREAFTQNILLLDKTELIFFHDQVQAAAESFMSDDNKKQVHHAIATAFINAIPDGSDYGTLTNLFSIVEHLSRGRLDNTTEEELCLEVQLNYHAGKAAMKFLAMDNANYYFKQAKIIYQYAEGGWSKDYDFLFLLYKNLARTNIALGNQVEASKILDILLQNSKNDLDRADCLYEQTTGLSSLGNFVKAIELGNRGLDIFNRRIPTDDKKCLDKADKIFAVMHKESENIWQNILTIEPSHDRKINIETGIYSELIPDYYLSGMVPQLYLSAMQSTQNCLAGGVDESVIYGFSMMGLYLQRRDEYELSFRYEDLGLALAERYPDTFGSTKGINGILWTNRHNRENSKTIIELCQENIHRGKNCGDLYNAGLSYGPYIWHLVCQSNNLEEVSEIAEECIAFSEKFNLSLSSGLAKSAMAGWSALMRLDAHQFSNEEISLLLEKWHADKHVVSIGGYYTLRGMAHHYLGEYDNALENLEQAQPYLRGLSDNILNRLWYVFRYINGLHSKKTSDQEDIVLEKYLQRVETWARLGPILKPYLALMKAEKASYQDNFSEARRYFLDAIDASRNEKFILLEAFLEQRYGELLSRHEYQNAEKSFIQSIILYRRCGADVKAIQVQKKYSIIIPEQLDEKYLESDLNELLDFQYLQTATAEITEQLDFHPLITTIVKAIMERLGAKNAFLLLIENGELKVLAKGIKEHVVQVELMNKNEGIVQVDTLSMAIVNYVYTTKKLLVLENASKQGSFKVDPTVVSQQLKSIFCLPIIKQKKVMGVLYLENNLIASVFNEMQIEMARLLISQAAVALENAYLFQEMKRNQDELIRSNDNLEITLNSIGDAVITTDNKGIVTRMNPVAEKLTGWPYEEGKGKSLKLVFPIVDATTGEQVENPVEKVLASNSTVHLNNHISLVSRDGKKYQIADSAAPIRNGNDDILGLVLVFNDVTESYRLREQEKIIKQQLQIQRDKLRQLNQVLEKSPVVVFRWKADEGWPVELVSNNIDRYGYTAEQFISGEVPYLSIIHPDDKERVLREVKKYSETGHKEFRQEYRIVTAYGKVRWTDDRTSVERNSDGEITHYQGTVVDITAEHEVRLALEQNEYELNQTLNNLFEAVISINESGEILNFNNSAERLFGYSKIEIIGHNISLLIPDWNLNYFSQTDIGLEISKRDLSYENEYLETTGKNKNTANFPVNISLTELPNKSGKNRQFIVSCVDLTKQKLQQAQIQRSQKMDALGKLVGGIAHDYNNMLGVIIGYTDLIRMKFQQVEGLDKYIEPIAKAGGRGRNLTARMLAFSKNESTQPKAVNIHDILEEQKDLISKSLTASVRLEYKFCDTNWLAWIDQSEFEDALLNLIINSKYAMPNGGDLTISSEAIYLDSKNANLLGLVQNEYFKLSINDTGCGIDCETISNIFDPFFTTKGVAGTGLGLSQVYGFMDRSGGSIKVYSRKDSGTKVSLYFPRYLGDEIPVDESKKNLDYFQGNGEKILIVDDEPSLRSMAKETLSMVGYKVLTASDGLEAIELLASEKVDMIFSDVIMPNMDGYQLACKAQALYPNVIILLTSGFSDNRHHSSHNEKLFKQLLPKPYSTDQLLEQVAILFAEKS